MESFVDSKKSFVDTDSELQNEKEKVMDTLEHGGDALPYISARLQDDEEVVKLAVGHYRKALHYASTRLQDNEEVVKVAVEHNGNDLCYASPRLRDNEEIVKIAVTHGDIALYYASPRLRDDEEIVKLAIKHFKNALRYASPRLQDNEDIVRFSILKNKESIEYASLNQQKNPDILFYLKEDYSDVSDEKMIEMNLKAYPYLDFSSKYNIRFSNHDFRMINLKKIDLSHLDDSFSMEMYCKHHFDVIAKLLNKYYISYSKLVVSDDKTKNNIYDFIKIMVQNKSVLSKFYQNSEYTIADLNCLNMIVSFYDDEVQKTYKQDSSEFIEKYRGYYIGIYNEIMMNKSDSEQLDKVLKKYGLSEDNIYQFVLDNKYYDRTLRGNLFSVLNIYYGKSIRIIDVFDMFEEMISHNLKLDEILEIRGISKRDFNKIYASAKENNPLLYNYIFDSLHLNQIRGFKKILRLGYKVVSDEIHDIDEYNRKYSVSIYQLLSYLKYTELYPSLMNKAMSLNGFDIDKIETSKVSKKGK